MTPEAKTKKNVKTLLEANGVYHFFPAANGYGRAGIPDIVCCLNGRFFAIECKAGKGKTTALQDRELDRIKEAGGYFLVVYDDPKDYNALQAMIDYIKERR